MPLPAERQFLTPTMKNILLSLGAVVLVTPAGFAETLQSARVTKVVNEVRLYQPSAASKNAAVGDRISGKTSLQTGRRSRSELIFQDDTLTRLGSNSIFSFERGSRDLALEQGTVLLSVPKNAGGARIRTATVTAAVTGTTVMMEYYLKKWVKIIVLEGSLVAWLEGEGKKRDRRTIRAGQMLILKADDRRMPRVVTVDLARILKTAGLLDPGIFGPLPVEARNLISTAIGQQDALKTQGFLVPLNQGGGGASGGGPAGGGTNPAQRNNDNRDDIVPPLPEMHEGDEPNEGDPPIGGNPPGEGDDP